MSGPKNTIISDVPSWQPPVKDPQAQEKPKVSDWARLGKSRKYKDVDAYLEARKEYFRHFLPGGRALAELAIDEPAKAGQWAAISSVIVDEIEGIQFRIQREMGN